MVKKIPPPPPIANMDPTFNRWLLELTSILNNDGTVNIGDSPVLTGVPTAPTAPLGTDTNQIATTAFVLENGGAQPSVSVPLPDATPGQIGASPRFARADHVHPTDTTRAPVASPTFTGTPHAPTPAINDNSPNIATTAYVLGQLSTILPVVDGTAAIGTSSLGARADHRHPTDTTRAPIASPAFTGVPTAPTAAPGDNSTTLATTAFVQAAAGGLGGTAFTTFLPADVPFGAPFAYTNILSVNLAAGTYVVFATASLKDTVSAAPLAARLVNGSTVLGASGFINTAGAGARNQYDVTVAFTLAAAGTVTLQAMDAGGTGGRAVANDTGNPTPMDTSVTWLKL